MSIKKPEERRGRKREKERERERGGDRYGRPRISIRRHHLECKHCMGTADLVTV